MSACRGLHNNVTAGCKKDGKSLQIDEEDIATVQTPDSIAGGHRPGVCFLQYHYLAEYFYKKRDLLRICNNDNLN
jgi:hypothetical protein